MHIENFEQISEFTEAELKHMLAKVDIIDIVKASMGASPQINSLFENTFLDVDFKQKYTEIGSIRIKEVEDAQKLIIDLINLQ